MATEAKLRTAHDSCDVTQYGNPSVCPGKVGTGFPTRTCVTKDFSRPARKMSPMPHAIRIHANGNPDVMRWEEVQLPAPRPGEARIRHPAIGINYWDVNVRRGGFYLVRPPKFPLVLGNEAAGVVTEVGHGVSTVKPGESVVYAGMRGEFFEGTGAYAG